MLLLNKLLIHILQLFAIRANIDIYTCHLDLIPVSVLVIYMMLNMNIIIDCPIDDDFATSDVIIY